VSLSESEHELLTQWRLMSADDQICVASAIHELGLHRLQHPARQDALQLLLPEEIAIIKFWRGLSFSQKRKAVELLRAGAEPSDGRHGHLN